MEYPTWGLVDKEKAMQGEREAVSLSLGVEQPARSMRGNGQCR